MIFFKGNLHGVERFKLFKGSEEKKKAVMVYSGGDDMFFVGSWNDIIELAVDIKHCFDKYTAGTLTFSAGIGLYGEKYPIYAMAQESEILQEASKNVDGKNAVSLFGMEIDANKRSICRHTYSWDDFTEKVVKEKLRFIEDYFSIVHSERSGSGNAFLYRLKEYIDNMVSSSDEEEKQNRINIARFAYLLSRLEPTTSNPTIKEKYSEFSTKMYRWIQEPIERRMLSTAITLYILSTRKNRRNENEG
ncbi:MAG TPA: hypothetical protein VHO66_00745 [Ruminiclostridium sp.]|nr:hypothetical protein [Ruminiclostridium sp.]